MAGDYPPWWQWGPLYAPYPVHGYTVPLTPLACNWHHDKGNESYCYFTSCGKQIGHYESEWKHCPHCGGVLNWPDDPPGCGSPKP